MHRTRPFSLVAAIFAAGSLATVAEAGPGGTNAVAVTGLNARDVGYDIYVSGLNSPLGCSNSNTIRIPNSVDNHDAMVANAISAYSLNRLIRVYASACDVDNVTIAHFVEIVSGN